MSEYGMMSVIETDMKIMMCIRGWRLDQSEMTVMMQSVSEDDDWVTGR